MSDGTIATIDSKVVDRALRQSFWVSLAEHGFDRRTGRTAWRDAPACVHTVNVQSFNRYLADQMGSTTFSFAINLGVFYPAISTHSPFAQFVKDPARPAEQQCQARFHMAKGLSQPDADPGAPAPPPLDPRLEPRRWRDRPDVWCVSADGSNLDEVVADARDRVLRIALPWFERLSDLREARRVFLEERSTSHAPGIVAEGYAGALGSPLRTAAIEALDIVIEGPSLDSSR